MGDNPFAIDFRDAEPVADDVAPVVEIKDQVPSFLTGIHRIPSAQYHADPAPEPSLSATLAKLIIRKTAKHAWTASSRLNPNWKAIDKKTFDIGRAAHRAVLGYGDDYIAVPEEITAKNGAFSTTEAKAFVAAQREAGRTPLKTDEVAQIEEMASAAHEQLLDNGIMLDPRRSEICAIAQVGGVWCRIMVDNAPDDPMQPLWDFKTCEDASPEACQKAIERYGYDVQGEHYLAVWKAATGEDRQFDFLFQEKSPPYALTRVGLSGSYRDLAQRRATRARKVWATCISTNKWPGYPAGRHEVDPPAWAVEREFQEDM